MLICKKITYQFEICFLIDASIYETINEMEPLKSHDYSTRDDDESINLSLLHIGQSESLVRLFDYQ